MLNIKRTVLAFVVITIILLHAVFEAVLDGDANASSVEYQMEETQVCEEYLIQPGDLLSIKFFYHKDLNEEEIIVLPDGRVTLQMVQGVMAAGVTVKDFTNILKKKYLQHIEKPDITVIIHSSTQKIYVGGEVVHPQMINLEGPMTVLQSILQAGGFKDTASHSKVIVIRNNGDSTKQIIHVNIKEVFNGSDLNQDIRLMPQDIIFVKETIF
ncbi:MAG: sugar transporter [Candidatus Brocadiaceae bacterium]|nr:sugar transporter [Candidatus Brocadiaceae bacterium]